MIIDRYSAVPLHKQLENIFRTKLQKGEWVYNQMIPSESQLVDKYHVSRITIRNVIMKLVQEKLLYRIPGKGTFVSSPVKIVTQSLSYVGIIEELEQQGYEVATKVVSLITTFGTPLIRDSFGLPADTEYYRLKRVRYVKDSPISMHISYFPVMLCPNLDRYDFAAEQKCMVLSEHYGLDRCRILETLESVPASKDAAKYLNISEKSPLLQFQNLIFDKQGRPFEHSTVLFRGEMIKLSLEFS